VNESTSLRLATLVLTLIPVALCAVGQSAPARGRTAAKTTAKVKPPAAAPASAWAAFQKRNPGRYCFYSEEKAGTNTNESYLNVTIEGDALRLSQGGIMTLGSSRLFYGEDMTGAFEEKSIVGTSSKTPGRAVFVTGTRTLTNEKERLVAVPQSYKLVYSIVVCRDPK
jgi:hypothetical protein